MSKKSGPPKAANPDPAPDLKARPDFFENLGSKANWVVLGLVSLLAFIVFKDFILQQKVYLFKDIGSDSVNASLPWMLHSADYISRYGVPSWSFNMGMGQNILSFSCYDPFDYLLYPFGKENIPYLIIYKELAKILLTAFLFFKYLKLLKLSNYTSILGSLMFSFSGYMILGSCWFLFSFEVFNAALLLFTFELLYQKRKWYWFAIPIFLIGISRPFNFWLYGVFLTAYILFRQVQNKEKVLSKGSLLLLGRVIGVALLGIGLSAPLLLEHLQVIIDSPRGSGPDSYSATLSAAPMFGFPDKSEFGTGMLRFFSNDILGSGINFKGWQNFLEAPEFYCGIPCLLLFTQFFQFTDKREKRAAIILLAFWLLPVIFPYFRKAFYLFTGDYYRSYSFFVAFLLIYLSVRAFDKIVSQNKVNMKALLITTAVLLILLNYPYFKEKGIVVSSMKMFANTALLVYAFLIYLIGKNKQNLNYRYALMGVFFIELAFFSWTTMNKRENANGLGNPTVKNMKEKIWYNDYTLEAVDYLKKTDKSFYRVDKNYVSTPAIHGSLNDAMVQDYYSTPSYNPFNHKGYINYMKTMGVMSKVSEYESRWSSGLINRFILQSLNNVKYILAMRDPQRSYSQWTWNFTHDSITRLGNVTVLRNKYNMPLGFGYGKYVKLSDFDRLPVTQKDLVSTKACVVNDEDVAKLSGLIQFNLKDTLPGNLFTFDVFKQHIDTLRKDTMKISSFEPTAIKGSVDLPNPRMLYLAIPYDKSWTVTDNGSPAEKLILSGGMTGLMLGKGKHDLEFRYTSVNFSNGKNIFLVSLLILVGIIFVHLRVLKKQKKQHVG